MLLRRCVFQLSGLLVSENNAKAVTGFLNVGEVTNVAPKLQDASAGLLKRLRAPAKRLTLFLCFDDVHSLTNAVDDDAYQRDARFPTRRDVLCSTLAHLLTTENTGKSNVFFLSMSTEPLPHHEPPKVFGNV